MDNAEILCEATESSGSEENMCVESHMQGPEYVEMLTNNPSLEMSTCDSLMIGHSSTSSKRHHKRSKKHRTHHHKKHNKDMNRQMKRDHKALLQQAASLQKGMKKAQHEQRQQLRNERCKDNNPINDNPDLNANKMASAQTVPQSFSEYQSGAQSECNSKEVSSSVATNESVAEIDGVQVNLVTKRRQKRACAFKREELDEIVDFLDKNNYDEGKKGEKNEHKAHVMKDLSSHLYQKFGKLHTKQQCMKRWHDLKNRETHTLIEIRKKIRKEKQRALREAQESTSKARDVFDEPQSSMSTLPIATVEDNIVTLTLHPVDPCNENSIGPSNQPVTPFLQDIENIVERVVSKHVGALQQQILSVINQLT